MDYSIEEYNTDIPIEERYRALQYRLYEVNKELLMYKTSDLHAYHVNNALTIEEYSKNYANGISNVAVIRLINLNYIDAVLKNGRYFIILTNKTRNYVHQTSYTKKPSQIRRDAMLTGKSEKSVRTAFQKKNKELKENE